MRFELSSTIPNDGPASLINEVSFHPSGRLFAASFENVNEVRILDTQTLEPIRVLRNPDAALSRPHGVLVTGSHVLVANKGDLPGRIQVFRLDDASGRPVQSFTTPFPHLAEGHPHSMALHGRRLVLAYCEDWGREGSIVSHVFDDEAGRIGEPLDIHERWFQGRGDGKGICFDASGDHVFATFQSDFLSPRQRFVRRLKNALTGRRRGGPSRNGLVKFNIDARGRFSREPVWSKVCSAFCRLENIHVHGDRAVVTDPDAASVRVYDLHRDPDFEQPVQVIREPLVFPHGAKFSPDGELLLVSDNGIPIVDHDPQWRSFVSPRKDRLLVFRLQAA